MAFRSTAGPVRPHCVVVSRPEVRSPSEVVWSLCTPSTAHMAWRNFIDQAGGSRDSTPGTQFWRCGNEMPKGEPCGSLTSQELRSGVWGGCVIALCGVPSLTQRRGIRKRTWGRPGTMWEPGCAGGGGRPVGPQGSPGLVIRPLWRVSRRLSSALWSALPSQASCPACP